MFWLKIGKCEVRNRALDGTYASLSMQ